MHITTQKLTAENFAARLKQVNLASKNNIANFRALKSLKNYDYKRTFVKNSFKVEFKLLNKIFELTLCFAMRSTNIEKVKYFSSNFNLWGKVRRIFG